MTPQPLRPTHSAPPFLRHRLRRLHTPNANMGIFSGPAGRSPDDTSHSPRTAYPTQSALDMLAHTELADACPSPKIEQVCCHPQTRPSNESSTADAQSL